MWTRRCSIILSIKNKPISTTIELFNRQNRIRSKEFAERKLETYKRYLQGIESDGGIFGIPKERRRLCEEDAMWRCHDEESAPDAAGIMRAKEETKQTIDTVDKTIKKMIKDKKRINLILFQKIRYFMSFCIVIRKFRQQIETSKDNRKVSRRLVI